MDSAEQLEGFDDTDEVGQYLKLKAQNHELFQSLVRQGVQVPPFQVLSMQFETLLEILGPGVMAEWAMAFENKMRAFLEGIEAELPRMKLTQPGQVPPAMQQPTQPGNGLIIR